MRARNPGCRDNGALTKNGQRYSNYFHALSDVRKVTIPKIDSARLYLSVGGPKYIQVNLDGAGHITYAGPNIDVTFDFVEMAINDAGFVGNTTRVDQFGFPVKLRLQVSKATTAPSARTRRAPRCSPRMPPGCRPNSGSTRRRP